MSLQVRLAALAGRMAEEFNEIRDAEGHNRRLAPFHLALAGQKNAPCNIFFLGDSVGEGASTGDARNGRAQAILAKALRDETGGDGYLPAWFASPFVTNPATFSHTPVSAPGTGNPPVVYDLGATSLGLASRRIGLQRNGWAEWTFIGDQVRVWYDTSNFFALNGKVIIDGVEATVIASAASTPEGMMSWTSNKLARGKHTVRVQEPSNLDGSFWLEAVQFFDGDLNSGVQIYDGTRSGVSASYFTNPSAQWHNSLPKVSPALVVIMLGFNDMNGNTPAQFLTNLRALVTRIRSKLTDKTYTLAIVAPWAPAPPPAAGWAAYITSMETVAKEHPNGILVRIIDRWPIMVAGTSNPGMFATDTVHPNEAGQRLLGVYLADALGLPVKKTQIGIPVWQPATLINGWANYGGSFPNAEYIVDLAGVVHLRGMIRNGTAQAAIQLPPELAPSTRELFSCLGQTSVIARADVEVTGIVNVSQQAAVGQWVSLSGISWVPAISAG